MTSLTAFGERTAKPSTKNKGLELVGSRPACKRSNR